MVIQLHIYITGLQHSSLFWTSSVQNKLILAPLPSSRLCSDGQCLTVKIFGEIGGASVLKEDLRRPHRT